MQPQTNDTTGRRRCRNHGEKGYFGDPLTRKKGDCVRILLHNPRGIGFISDKRCKQTLKLEKLKKLILTHDFDLVGLTEVNKDWRKVSQDNTIWGATSGWREHRRIQVAQNVTKPPSNSDLLIGGTAMMAFDDFVFKISKQENDSRKLGRWCSLSITGKNNVITTIFTCYCPVRSTSLGSAYAQQLIYIAEHTNILPETSCPRQLFGLDLQQAVEEKVNLGHNVILMGDFNSDYNKLTTWMSELGLIDLIAHKHGHCPKTHMRSRDAPIDCIFGSSNLGICNGGFLAFHKLISDHRAIWIDIPKELLYGFNPPQPSTYLARRLKLEDPRVVKRYLDLLSTTMDQHDLFRRMDTLHNAALIQPTDRIIEEYELIDILINKLMQEAEAKCRKLHTGSISWSPAYKESSLLLEYWLNRRTYLLRKHSNVRRLIVLQNKLKIAYEPQLTFDDITQKIRNAHKYRRQCKQFADSLSLEYRTQLALAKEENGDTKAASYLKKLNYVESQRRLYRNIRHIEGKIRGGSTSKLITTNNGIEYEHTSKESIEKLCAAENERKYHQTESGGSQLLLPEYIQELGNYGEGAAIPQVLNGEYTPPPSASSATRDFLEACSIQNEPRILAPQNKDIVSRYQDHVLGWRKRKEQTCTHHLHIGHYKAALQNKNISWFLFQRSDIPEMTGYSPSRHRKCVDLMIMKKSQCYDVEKQRTIGILDTEYNQSNKKIGYDAMNHALSLQKIAPEQFAVKHTAAIEQIVSKRCMIDHNQSKRQCFSLTSSELAGCYDRIIHTAAALALLRVGIPHSKITSMFSSIQRMIHRIRTYFGDSELTYGGDDIGVWQNYPQGVLQGNASGPTIWALISTIIFEILHKRGFAVQICNSISKQLFYLVGFAYVDDCDLIQSGSTPQEVLGSMQELINSWGSLMEVTGGALSVDKSWWYLVEFVWKKGKWVTRDACLDMDLIALSPQGVPVSLKRLHASDASEMLGVWLAPDGGKDKFIKVQKQAALNWATKIKSGHPTQLEAWQALHTTITAKLRYPLPACSLTESECKSIMYPALKSALPKAGIASNIVGKIRDGPLEFGGAGVLSLFHYQGTARTSMLVEQVYKQSTTGKLILTCIEDLVLETGLYGSMWSMPFEDVKKYIHNHSLVYDIWKYNTNYDISISTKHAVLSPQREGDRSLMSLALSMYSDSASLRSIQRVRMAYNVVNLSEICSSDGKRLDIPYISSSFPITKKNVFDWPQKHNITRHDMAKWRKFVKRIFCINNTHLVQQLGPWKPMEYTGWISTWDYYTTPDREFLFHKISEDTWRRHLIKPNSRRSYHTQFLDMPPPRDTVLLRASIKASNHTLIIISLSSWSPPTVPTDHDYISFGNIRVKIPQIDWFMQNISSSTSTDHLLGHILTGSAITVSDGSFFPQSNVGTCSWILATPDLKEYIKGGGIVPGPPQAQSSYRSELGGLLGIANIVSNIVLPSTVSSSITVSCDGLAALNKVNTPTGYLKSKFTDIDLISSLHQLWTQSKICPCTQHVYGHQDTLGRPLTNIETLNCFMDEEAKDLAGRYIQDPSNFPDCHDTDIGFGSVKHENYLITSKLQASLYKRVTHKSMLQWLSSHGEIQSDLCNANIAWTCFSKARQESSLSIKLFITKWLSGDTATGRTMAIRKQRILTNCPRCDKEDEHLLHVLTCPASCAHTLRNKMIATLIAWLNTNSTHPHIIEYFSSGLSQWFLDQNYTWNASSILFSDCDIINQSLQSQLNIGWYHLLCGMLSDDLVQLQASYYLSIHSPKSATRWGSSLIKKLWNIIHQLWLQRNECLHTSESLHHMTRLTLLKASVTAEYNLGVHDLPLNYSTYFHLPLPTLLKKSPSYLKRWFLIIRSGRESLPPSLPPDVFSTNGPMRKWIKLAPVE